MGASVHSWALWSAGLAAIAAGAWMLHNDSPTTEKSPGGVGPHLPLAPVAEPAQPTPTLPPPSVASAPASTADRFKLVGVMTINGSNVAMIAVDGQQARMFRVGDSLDGRLLLRTISVDEAVIGLRDGGASVVLKTTTSSTPASAQVQPSRPRRALDLSDGSPESAEALRNMGARNAPLKPLTAAEREASAAEASGPADPGTWRPPGQP